MTLDPAASRPHWDNRSNLPLRRPSVDQPGVGRCGPDDRDGDAEVQITRNPYAIISVILGVVSIPMCLFGLVTGILGVGFGVIGLQQRELNGRGMAITGTVLSSIAIVFWAVFLVWGLASGSFD